MAPEKNLYTLLNSFLSIAKDDALIKLVLVGTGPEESKLREFVSKNGLEGKVIFCGVRYDIDKLLCSFDIFVLPSFTEELLTALLEAMGAGRAIICSDIEANHELVEHNKESIMVNPHHPIELERAIRLLCANEMLRYTLGNNAKNKALEYDENKIFPKVLRYYEDYLNKG